MKTHHLLLGRTWQFDGCVTHDVFLYVTQKTEVCCRAQMKYKIWNFVLRDRLRT